MIRKVLDWRIIEQAPEVGKEPDFSVIIADREISTRPILSKVPYSGITDTTISPDTHDLYIETETIRSNAPKTDKGNIFFRKKASTEEGGAPAVSRFNNVPASAVFGDKVSIKRKAIIDEDTGASISVSQNATAMGSPGQEIIAGENGVTMTGGSPRVMDLPSDDHVMLKQTGLLRILPKCFVPPFSMPDYLPDLNFMTQVAKTIAIFKAMSDLSKRGL